ncbi:SMC-Scp complex subunit ScpB [Vagococcus elongatus]|uniref:Segregation and condensation protein B n=1 Tax=Vagococcus elongatus TaxID=180344 RepID=A0A430B5D0_9ENTE|nr:SMC-Scp complex subunit ScpB [Vagococcus elongatus]
MKSLYGKIESLLFVVGEEGISLDELSFLLKKETAEVFEAIRFLEHKYQKDRDCALHILEVGNQFILSTKKECADLLKKYAQSPMSNHLSQAALETLSIIAYKQPVTRMEIDEIRGVQSTGSVQKLLARQLIEEKGRVNAPGRAILYGTSTYFMNYFGLETINDLPSVKEMEAELIHELPSDLFFDKFKKELEGQGIHDAESFEEIVSKFDDSSIEEASDLDKEGPAQIKDDIEEGIGE